MLDVLRLRAYDRSGRIDSSSDLPRSIHENRLEHCGYTNSSGAVVRKGVERIESVTCDDVDFKPVAAFIFESYVWTNRRPASAVSVTKNLHETNLSSA